MFCLLIQDNILDGDCQEKMTVSLDKMNEFIKIMNDENEEGELVITTEQGDSFDIIQQFDKI